MTAASGSEGFGTSGSDLTKDDEQDEAEMTCCMCKVKLLEPLQLRCLHSCCTGCAQRATASAEGVMCPICDERTETARLQPNLFLAGRARLLKILSGSCQTCSTEDDDSLPLSKEGPDADSLCLDCMAYMCNSCLREHKRLQRDHIIVPWVDVRRVADIADRCFPSCRKHNDRFSHACLTCGTLQCIGCLPQHCKEADQHHDVQKLDSCPVRDYACIVQSKLDCFSNLQNCVTALHVHNVEFAAQMKDYRETNLANLKKRKQILLDNIESEYRAAEDELFSTCDAIDIATRKHSDDVQRLKQRLTNASRYCHVLVDSKNISGLVSQVEVIGARWKQLHLQFQQLESTFNNTKSSCIDLESSSNASLQIGVSGERAALASGEQLLSRYLPVNKCFSRGLIPCNQREGRSNACSQNDDTVHIYADKEKRQEWKSFGDLELDIASSLSTIPPVAKSRALSTTSSSILNQQIDGTCPSLKVDYENMPENKTFANDSELDIVSTHSTNPPVTNRRTSTTTGSSISNQRFNRTSPPLKDAKDASYTRRRPQNSEIHKRPNFIKQPFKLMCSTCEVLAVTSEELRLIGMHGPSDQATNQLAWHHVVIDASFDNRITLKPHYRCTSIGKMVKLECDVRKEYKLHCKKCQNDWGVAVRIQEKLFFFLKVDPFCVFAEERIKKYLNWRDFPYHIEFIRDKELISHGKQEAEVEILSSKQELYLS